MGHHTHPYIYGVVDFDHYQGCFRYSVTWAVDELFNMSNDKVMDVNIENQYFRYLDLVRDKDKASKGDYKYVKQYFRYDGKGLKIANITLLCNICLGEEHNEGTCTNICRRSYYRTQLPMMQFYYYLELNINEHIAMAQQSCTCHKHFAKVVHGVLVIVGDRRKVWSCVNNEIRRKYPRD